MKTNLTVSTNGRLFASHAVSHETRRHPRWVIVCLAFLALAMTSARAQDTPRIQVFGGYSYTVFDSKSLGFSGNSGLNGGTLMVAGNLHRNFGGLAQVSISGGSGITLRDALFGPQFLLPRGKFLFYAHGLFGRVRTSVHTGVQPEPLDTQNAEAFGGGVDMHYRHRLAIRLIQVDYVRTQLFQQDQNNLRFSTGVVYEWGALRRKAHRAPSIPTP